MTEYRLKAVLEFLLEHHGYASANEVAKGVGMSWNTAKNDLELLEKEGYVLKRGKRRQVYALNKNRLNDDKV